VKRTVIVLLLFISAFLCNSQTYWNRANLFSLSGGIYTMMKLKVEAEIQARDPVEYNVPSSFPPIHLKYEYFLGRQSSIGAEFSYASAHGSFSKMKFDEIALKDTLYSYKVRSSNPAVAAFFSVHSNNRKLSPFFSFGIQINLISDKFISTNDPHAGKDDYSTYDDSMPKTIFVQLGLRYMVNEHIGIITYASFFPSIIAAGVCYKLRKE
jgi:hypothetical protein